MLTPGRTQIIKKRIKMNTDMCEEIENSLHFSMKKMILIRNRRNQWKLQNLYMFHNVKSFIHKWFKQADKMYIIMDYSSSENDSLTCLD
jgi:hypothetical protein